MAAEVVHKEVDIIIRLKDLMRSKNTSGYFSFYVDNVLEAEMTSIRLALEDASEARDKITILFDSCEHTKQ